MADPLELSQATIARLQKYAKPFVETVDSVINRILDDYEKTSRGGGEMEIEAEVQPSPIEAIRDFDPADPPNLTHTKVVSVRFNGTRLSRADTNWNALVNEAVRFAVKSLKKEENLKRAILANFVFGKKENDGHRYLPDVNVSIQGQDANSAWKTVYH